MSQNVTLPDGTTQRVLVRQVYVRVEETDLRADGTLMAGSSVRLQLQGDLSNSGTILGRSVTDIKAQNIGNAGRIASGDLALLTARQDIDSSGAIEGARIGLEAGNDIALTTQTSTSRRPNATRTAADRVASVNASQLLIVSAGNDITLAGAHVSSGGALTLDARRDLNLATVNVSDAINLRWDAKNHLNTSSNSSSSASIGIGIALGGMQNGITINAAASQARGNSDGTDTTNTLTTVTAGNGLTLTSGRDTSLIGATASGNSVTANVGRNLDIQSVQDTSTFTSKESSAGVGVSICVPPICYGASSASVSVSGGRVNGNYASVTTQSGIKAGDGGFNVNVTGNTNLAGAAITSSQSAVDAGKNSLATNTLTQSEIQNRDNQRASSIAASASYSSARQEYNPDTDQAQTARSPNGTLAQASNSQGIGVGHISGSQGSTTGSAISGATVAIKSGDTTALATIDRTAVTESSSANALTRTWNGQQLQQDASTQAQQMLAFGQSAPRLVADFAGQRYNELTAQAREAGDTPQGRALAEEAARWAEGGVYRVAAHTALGAVAGGIDGALGAGTVAAAAPLIDTLQRNVQTRLQDAGMSPDAARAVATVIGTGAATALGAAAGNGNAQAAAMAGNIDANNRQLHPTEVQWIARNARGYAQQQCGCANPNGEQIAQAERGLAEQAYRQVQFGAEGQDEGKWDAAAQAFLRTAPHTLLPAEPNFASAGPGYMFQATPEQRANAAMYLTSLPHTASFYAQNGLAMPTNEQIVNGANRDAQGRQLVAQQTINAALVAGALVLSPAVAGLASETVAFANNPTGYCLANPAGCTVAVDTIACIAAGPACAPGSAVASAAGAGRTASGTVTTTSRNETGAADATRRVGAAANAEIRAGSAGNSLYTSSRPMEEVFPELAGVNPHYVPDAPIGTNVNCVSCAVAAQQRLTGQNPNAVALPATRYSSEVELRPAAPFGTQVPTTVANVQQEMANAGNGAVGVVLIPQSNGIFHVINVVNRDGTVYFVDAQLGRIVTLPLDVVVRLGRP